MHAQTLAGGFTAAATEAAHVFRAVTEAMARPGTVHDIAGVRPPEPLSPAAGAVLLTLCDIDTPIHLVGDTDCEAVRQWLAFHTGAPFVAAAQAMFAVGQWADLAPLSAYPVGTSAYPDRSATLIVEWDTLNNSGAILTGPGIRDSAQLSLPRTDAFRTNHALYPRGLDFIFTCDRSLAALPRSTRVTYPEGA